MTLKNTSNDAFNHNNSDQRMDDEKYMQLAFKQAVLSAKIGEVPIGAVIVDNKGKIVAHGTNLREKEKTALGHAELVAIHRACKKLNSWRLVGCTLYVTLEPCFMCAGALVQSRISRVVFATHDPKGGALETLAQLGNDPRLNHRFEITSGILANESSLLLKNFFKEKRKKQSFATSNSR